MGRIVRAHIIAKGRETPILIFILLRGAERHLPGCQRVGL
jgi:hypothetical protein